ncbi:hypothetical protein VP01_2043g1 [Puccinia sorghi]|uniref:Uncharacterized protein n=1 Tax=Puccinia sorghi TaxID=27349 RepID=A0A0L6VAZ2_9BASI|nr:hypothetical protein VP01_2043g1 [Puccinia sorghi]
MNKSLDSEPPLIFQSTSIRTKLHKTHKTLPTNKHFSAAWISNILMVLGLGDLVEGGSLRHPPARTQTRAWKANQISSARQFSLFPPQKMSHSCFHSHLSLSLNLPRLQCRVFDFVCSMYGRALWLQGRLSTLRTTVSTDSKHALYNQTYVFTWLFDQVHQKSGSTCAQLTTITQQVSAEYMTNFREGTCIYCFLSKILLTLSVYGLYIDWNIFLSCNSRIIADKTNEKENIQDWGLYPSTNKEGTNTIESLERNPYSVSCRRETIPKGERLWWLALANHQYITEIASSHEYVSSRSGCRCLVKTLVKSGVCVQGCAEGFFSRSHKCVLITTQEKGVQNCFIIKKSVAEYASIDLSPQNLGAKLSSVLAWLHGHLLSTDSKGPFSRPSQHDAHFFSFFYPCFANMLISSCTTVSCSLSFIEPSYHPTTFGGDLPCLSHCPKILYSIIFFGPTSSKCQTRYCKFLELTITAKKKLAQLPAVDMQHATAKLPSKLHLFACVDVLAQPLCSLQSDCVSKLGLSLWEKGGSNTKSFTGLSACQLQAVEQVFFAVSCRKEAEGSYDMLTNMWAINREKEAV